ncbi:hypothetical protein A1O1_08254 [Capronia coronata CBS 617.96]|uniref:Beta-mannosidase B n=1 Tax=Capronia coronata CBS 617.96 TaxID=1182541 RepID=W9XHW4_9EURO|nr:uncharacterized protein A1O1_08254 [Capronia coronata CBS 617.96]EXJ80112.1 hypothetical protein A1O1_08254 [Capronia coronata CBS 617.96]
MSRQRNQLSSCWQWRLADLNGLDNPEVEDDLFQWHGAAHMPSVIHMELLQLALIPDPYINENERDVQWVGQSDWEYQCQFETPEGIMDLPLVELIFEGLDTFATVVLNGQEILKCDNMFLEHRIEVGKILKQEGSNTLNVYFESAIKRSTALQEQYGVRKALERDPRRMHIRKIQCQWGWDFGPQMLTAGPYCPVFIEGHVSRIAETSITSKLADDHSSAVIDVGVGIEGKAAQTSLHIDIVDENGVVVATKSITKTRGSDVVSLKVQNPELWWPNGHGKPTLYTAEIMIRDMTGKTLDVVKTKFGIRSIQLIQRELRDAPGLTFMFNVNGKDIFAQGGNWIPADTLLPRITREKYFDWIEKMQFAHHNMVRVWGGGIYETEDFLDACDAHGILLWHDFALACGDYPLNPAFIDSLKLEARHQTKRLRNRACLALLCGGNEDFLFQDIFWNGPYDHEDTQGPFEGKGFPQREIYLRILPEIVREVAPSITYWANSPWGGKKEANDLTVGDIHQWEVWHLHQYPYQDFPHLSGRFVSEFGMFSLPIMRTVEHFITRPEQRYPQSEVADCHSKASGQESRVARYLAENFRCDTSDMSNYAYLTQCMQSEAVWYGLCHWKRKFVPGKEECAGALVWQTNDLYPGMSWSYIDYFVRPKPAYYTIRRAFAPVQVGIQRSPRSRFLTEAAPERKILAPTFEIFAHNSTTKEVKCRLRLTAYDFKTHRPISLLPEDSERTVSLRAGQNTELASLHYEKWTKDNLIVLEASLFSLEKDAAASSAVLARVVDWPEPFRYLRWPKQTTRVTTSIAPYATNTGLQSASGLVTSGGQDPGWENTVTLTANVPIKGAWVEPIPNGKESVNDPEPLWSDNMVDLMPDSAVSFKVKGLKSRGVRVRYLYDWEV